MSSSCSGRLIPVKEITSQHSAIRGGLSPATHITSSSATLFTFIFIRLLSFSFRHKLISLSLCPAPPPTVFSIPIFVLYISLPQPHIFTNMSHFLSFLSYRAHFSSSCLSLVFYLLSLAQTLFTCLRSANAVVIELWGARTPCILSLSSANRLHA